MSDLIGRTLGPYHITAEIGSGGMANVYRAVQPSIGREVAIKVLPTHFMQDRTFLDRFSREVQIIAKLQHPRILPVYDFGEHEGLPYIVMAYMPGGTLADHIRREGGIPLDETARLVGQIAEGLDYAHEQGVIHRDFKPSNVLLDQQGNAYLSDFGIAKMAEATAQLTGSGVIGTPAYMAPEMASLGGVTPLVDVYALGATLYQMLTNQQPYQADTPMGVLMAHASKPIPDVREYKPDLPETVQRVIEGGMAKNSAERYQSASDLAADLNAAVAGAPVGIRHTVSPEAPITSPTPPDALTADVPVSSSTSSRVIGRPSAAGTAVSPSTAALAPRRRIPAWVWIGGVVALLCVGVIGVAAVFGSRLIGGPLVPAAPSAENTAGAATFIAPADTPTPIAPGPVTIRWFVGLGGGSQEGQLEAQQQVVDAFNASHPNIVLSLEIVSYADAYDELATRIAAGNAPDVVGPVGIGGLSRFQGYWLDLSPLIEQTGYDMSDFEPRLVDSYRFGAQGEQIGIPFAAYPSALWYNRDLFDQAGIAYPPHRYGVPYADGASWDIDKLRLLAMQLTVDTNSHNAASPLFSSPNVAQLGFDMPSGWTSARAQAVLFGAASLVDESGNAVIPGQWRAFWRWYYAGIWTDRFIPTYEQSNSDLLPNGDPFSSGNLAMMPMNLWYTCCVAAVNWDVAALPTYNGAATANLDADTFGILASTQHPYESFEVVTYLVGEAAPDLLLIYGGFPARKSLQSEAIAALNAKFLQGVDWQVFLDGLQYVDFPNHESGLPNSEKAEARLNEFQNLCESAPGLDLDAEIDRLRDDLQAIFQESQ